MTSSRLKMPGELAASATLVIVLLLLLDVSTQQQTIDVSNTRWKRTPLSDLGVKFLGHKAEFLNSSGVTCAVRCLHNPPCLSFSIHSATRHCFIFADRISFGINMQRESGYRHYWRIYGECPAGTGYSYLPDADVCFRAVTATADRLSWANAFAACQTDGGHLYIANTPEKMMVITSFIISNGYENLQFKLGGNDLFEEGWFLWLDGSPVTTWYTGQPDNRDGVQHCLENTVYHPDYNSDGICNSSDRYICQMPLN